MSAIRWTEAHTAHSARWHSENATPPPGRVIVAGDGMKADAAYRLASEGTALLWRGDFHNARQLLRAMSRRIDRKPPRPGGSPAESFHLHRRVRGHRARVLSRLLVLLGDDYSLALRRAPDVRRACVEAYGAPYEAVVVSLTELLGVIGAQQWRAKGVALPAINARIHPHYGVFSPIRGEHVDLVAQAPLPASVNHGAGAGPGRRTAFDLGTGTGVLAVEHGVYDPKGAMLHGFLNGLAARLEPGGEGWLILSDLAERLGLRTRRALLTAIDAAGLRVVDRIDTRPRHPRASDGAYPLHAARAAEVTSLWRLAVR